MLRLFSARVLRAGVPCVLVLVGLSLYLLVQRELHPFGRLSPRDQFIAAHENALRSGLVAPVARGPEAMVIAAEGQGRMALETLEPGNELLVTVNTLHRILQQTVVIDIEPTESEPANAPPDSCSGFVGPTGNATRAELLLRCAKLIPSIETHDPPLAIVKTTTSPPFLLVVKATGDHSEFLVDHLRKHGYAYRTIPALLLH